MEWNGIELNKGGEVVLFSIAYFSKRERERKTD